MFSSPITMALAGLVIISSTLGFTAYRFDQAGYARRVAEDNAALAALNSAVAAINEAETARLAASDAAREAIAVPLETVRVVEVPGPERIVRVPGPVVTKIVRGVCDTAAGDREKLNHININVGH